MTEADFAEWWGQFTGGYYEAGDDTDAVLRAAFQQVLSKLSQDEEHAFVGAQPTRQVLSGDASVYGVTHLHVSAAADGSVIETAVMDFDLPSVRRWARRGELADVVAHEMAHVVLGHYRVHGGRPQQPWPER